ncbi:molybdopterin cofactor-binding domain-containing protein [Piscinibacter sakaiensis]
MLGGWPGRIDGIDEVLRRPGVVRVLRLPPYAGGHAAVAVVGRSVWHARQGAATQVPGLARALAARVAGVAPEAVTVHVTLLGGGFGRRLDTEVVGQAVRIAQECQGRPVQLVWPREEDMTHDVYRPAGAAWMTARLDARGQPVSIRWTSAGDAISPRWMERNLPALAGPVDTPDKTTGEGLFDSPYAFPHQRIAHVATRSGVPVGFWRSVGHSHNAFFKEAFVDELAAEAGQDPVAFRLAWLRERLARLPRRRQAAAGGPRARGRAARELRQHRRDGGRGLARRGRAAGAPGGGDRAPAAGGRRGLRADGGAARPYRHRRRRGAADELPGLPAAAAGAHAAHRGAPMPGISSGSVGASARTRAISAG